MPEPYCLAMVLCDNVHRDPATGKSTILGTFSTLGAENFPTPIRMCVYWAITDALGEVELSFRLVDSINISDDSTEPVFQVSIKTESPSPLAVIEGSLTIMVDLPEHGVYHCEMLHGEELLMSRRLVAIQLPVANEENENE